MCQSNWKKSPNISYFWLLLGRGFRITPPKPVLRKLSCSEWSFISWEQREWRNWKPLLYCCTRQPTNCSKNKYHRRNISTSSRGILGGLRLICSPNRAYPAALELLAGKQTGFYSRKIIELGNWRVGSGPNFTCPYGWLLDTWVTSGLFSFLCLNEVGGGSCDL